MADESVDQTKTGEQKPDASLEIKNLKSEFSRKQENVMSELNSIKQLLAQKQQVQQRHQVEESDETPDPVLEPKKYAAYIKQQVMQESSQMINVQNQRQAQLAALVQSFPELQDGSAELTQLAVQKFSALSDAEKMSPSAYKFAVQDAASELGVLPMNKRQSVNKQPSDDGDESFTTNSGSYASNKRSSSKQKQSDKIDDATLAFAQAIGKDTSDPKYIEELKKYSNRKDWNKKG